MNILQNAKYPECLLRLNTDEGEKPRRWSHPWSWNRSVQGEIKLTWIILRKKAHRIFLDHWLSGHIKMYSCLSPQSHFKITLMFMNLCKQYSAYHQTSSRVWGLHSVFHSHAFWGHSHIGPPLPTRNYCSPAIFRNFHIYNMVSSKPFSI